MITSRQNQRLKDIRRLYRSKGHHALLEGTHLVSEALDAGLALGEVLATPEYLATSEGAELAARLPHPPLVVAAPLLDSLADADSPRGLIAVASLAREGAGALPRAGEASRRGVYVFADGLQDPGNLGALARVVEAAGAAGLALAPGSAHPNHPRALRASAGSLLRLPVASGVTAEELSSHLEARGEGGGAEGASPASVDGPGPRWAALAPRGGTPWTEADLSPPLVLALGAEGPGLSPEVLERCTLRVSIPLAPPVESLNAVVAAALLLFEARRRLSPRPTSPEA